MLKAFSEENHKNKTDFNWEEHYGDGFSCVDFKFIIISNILTNNNLIVVICGYLQNNDNDFNEIIQNNNINVCHFYPNMPLKEFNNMN